MRRLITLMLAGILAVLTGLVVATPAQAVSCNSGTFCLYDNANGTGLMYARRVSTTPQNTCISVGSASNRAEYVRNREAVTLIVYDSASCASNPGIIHPGSYGEMTGEWDGTISSWCWCT
jgi:hypothetical protein